MLTYVAELRALAANCNFKDTLDVMLRDRMVCGINDTATQKRLLAEPKLTFKKALDIACSLETATCNVKELKTPHVPEVTSAAEVLAVEEPQKPITTCFHCGKPGHYAFKCRVSKVVICHQCGKAGHLRKCCKIGLKRANKGPRTRPSSVQHVVEEDEQTKEPEAPILPVGSSNRTPPYMVTVEANGVGLQMEVDTGSSVSLVSQLTFRKLWPERKLSECKYHLRSYAEKPIKMLGCTEVELKYNGQEARLSLIVVEGSGPTLLGRSWLKHIHVVLDWQEIRHLSTCSLQEVLDKHPVVFGGGLGTLKNFEAKIHDPNATPRFCKARSVPYALRKVEEELERLVREGTLEPIQVADWAAPIVPVLKGDKSSVRICGDFRP